MPAYYNEIDPYAAQWLRNLIAAGLIAPGDVDERSVIDVRPAELRGYAQCHFFAGIGIWSCALRLAGWPDDRPVWTGSCPCQPFSSAGDGAGFEDARHLWPAWGALIRECRPGVVFGEQAASKDGRAWLDIVWADMEDWGYAFAPVLLPACGVGAPHRRDRLWFVADANRDGYVAAQARATAPHEERHLAPHQQGRPAVGYPARASVPAPWPPGLSGIDSIPVAVDGDTRRVGGIRAAGNAIVAPVAAEFIRAYLDVTLHAEDSQ